MAKNVQGVIFLRNGSLYANRDAALEVLSGSAMLNRLNDGEMALARYGSGSDVKTLAGIMYKNGDNKSITVIDVEGASADVEALRQEINAKLGNGITSSNTATAQLAALSGGTFVPGTSSSAETSVAGAKAYAYDLVGTLEYTDTAETGSYVSKVDQVDGIISTTKVALPTVTGEVESKKVVMSVSEDKGEISVTKGTIESADKTVVISNLAEGNGIDFSVNIDNATLEKNENGVISVASAALTQYSGDNVTIQVSAVDANNNKTISSLLTIEEVTASVPDTVAHRFQLAGSDHVKIGEYIDIPKDSALVNFYLGHVDDLLQGTQSQSEEGDTATVVPGTGDTALVWIMLLNDGKYKLTAVNVESFIEEAEFASGVTWDSTAKKVKGVVDPQTEVDSNGDAFLTVGTDGFKVDGIKDEIAAQLGDVVAGLDADESGSTEHITVNVVESDGVITTVTVEEDNIANADDLEALSGKTITAMTSTNGSIAATISNEAGNKTADIQTDADKIQMSGFSADNTTSLSGIAESDSIATAFEKTNAVITENERVTAGALNDLDGRLDVVEGEYISGVSVNGVAVTPASKVAPISITASNASSATASDPAIIVNTDNSTGAITLGIGYIDCGTYDDPQP